METTHRRIRKMRYEKINLQLFEDGGGAGSGGQGGNAGNGNGGQGNAGATYSFEQAEEIANARAQRAEQAALRSYFQQQGMTQEEATQALAQFRQQREANKPNISAIEKERDEARKELEAYRQKDILKESGVEARYEDYVLFEIIQGVVTESAVLRMGCRLPNMSSNKYRMPVLDMLPMAYFVNGDSGQKKTTAMQSGTNYSLDGSSMYFPNNGVFDKNKALMISGDFSQLVYAMRQDITFKLFTEGVVQKPLSQRQEKVQASGRRQSTAWSRECGWDQECGHIR